MWAFLALGNISNLGLAIYNSFIAIISKQIILPIKKLSTWGARKVNLLITLCVIITYLDYVLAHTQYYVDSDPN